MLNQETAESQPPIKDLDFLQIDVTMVAVGVARQAELWKTEYGEALHSHSFILYSQLSHRIGLLEEQTAAETADIDQLKFVLNIIAEVVSMVQVLLCARPWPSLSAAVSPHCTSPLHIGGGAGHSRHHREVSHSEEVRHRAAC